MFQVGDIVMGKPGSPYSVTNENMTRGEVIRLRRTKGRGDIVVRVLERNDGHHHHIGSIWWVDSQHFELVDPPIEINITTDELFELLNVHKYPCQRNNTMPI